METEITPGLAGEVTVRVTEDDTAAKVGSGSLPVLATPRLAALMERAACLALEGRLPEGQTTVGTSLTLTHSAPTPVGMEVTVRARVVRAEGRTVTFRCEARDSAGPIGEADHTRVTVFAERFMKKAQGKLG